MKRWLPLLALAVFFIVCGLLITSGRSKTPWNEPSYNGRSLSSWLKDFGSRPIGGGLTHKQLSNARQLSPKGSPGDAIRAMGTNALAPLLLQMKRNDDPSWLAAVKNVFNKQTFLKLQLRDPQTQREQAAMAFFELGTAGLPALPELATLLTNYSSAACAAHALAGMGTSAVPVFASALTNSNTWINDCGVWGLAQIGAESRVAVPQILPLLQGKNTADVMITLWALSQIREPVEVIRPEMMRLLGHSGPGVRRFAAQALQRLGSDAKPGLSEIKTALEHETDAEVRTELQKLIKDLGQDNTSLNPATPPALP